jgi:hypothetical protein
MAAGLGFIEFTTGDVLTAAAANGYLASQVVMVFADSAARTAAITSPQEGMFSYLKDTNSTEFYTGAAWTPVGGGGGGKVLQVVAAYTTTLVSNSTSTYADTTLTATITPSAATSKILVLVSQNGVNKTAGNAINGVNLRLLRTSTTLSTFAVYQQYTATTLAQIGSSSIAHLDSPSTTSATTYKTQFMNPNNTAAANVQLEGDQSSIILIEIGA